MKINAEWHKQNKLTMPTTLSKRVKWHEEHLKHCGCRKDLPKTILAELEKQGKHVCSRGHLYEGNSVCPTCYPGYTKTS